MQIFTKKRAKKYRNFLTRCNESITPTKGFGLLLLIGISTLSLNLKAANNLSKEVKLIGKDGTFTQAASFVLSGVVVDDKDEPLPGASVRIKNSGKGTMTDVYGKFLIEVPTENDSLV